MKNLIALVLAAFGVTAFARSASAGSGDAGAGSGGVSDAEAGEIIKSRVPMVARPILPIVRQVLQAAGNPFSVAEIMAFIEIESSFNPRAFREERHLSDASRGLMQVLLSTARDRGYSGPADGLFDPLTNVEIGVAHLMWTQRFLRQRLGSVPMEKVVGAYNAGVGNALKGYFPASYIAKWQSALTRWRGYLGE